MPPIPPITIEHLHIDSLSINTHRKPYFQWHIGPIAQKERVSMPVEVTLTNEQKVRVAVTPMTAAGRPTTLDGPASFTVTSGDCTIEAIDDTSAFIVSGDTLTDSVVTVSGDADLGAGIETVMDTVLVHTTHANAANLGLTLDTPELK